MDGMANATIIDGRHIADAMVARLRSLPKPDAFLAVVLVGDDASSVSFLTQKEKIAKDLGVDFRWYRFPADVTNDTLREEVGKIGAHKTCGGIIVQLPLPEHLQWHYILNAIPPEKDVDVLGERTLGAFYVGRSTVVPPVVRTVEAVIEESHFDIAKGSVAIVGLGLLVGRPVATWLMRRAKETFLLRSTSDLGILKQADLVITGVGKAGLITGNMLKPGAGVIDFGYGDKKGDFDMSDANVSFYTPTPGGTGPILVASVFENFYTLAEKRKKV
jgi:methylenetetrahydrofolate dehydrogenase (NADP+)/methenyltetrahydrofolate cyclohydrolase